MSTQVTDSMAIVPTWRQLENTSARLRGVRRSAKTRNRSPAPTCLTQENHRGVTAYRVMRYFDNVPLRPQSTAPPAASRKPMVRLLLMARRE